jgi:fucose 4-O-acetylase-like acetyltransferase
MYYLCKGGFFSESVIRFSNLQKILFQKTILNFKFQVQDSFWNIILWRFGDLKNESHFLKKATFN